jgi:hypothetical protein
MNILCKLKEDTLRSITKKITSLGIMVLLMFAILSLAACSSQSTTSQSTTPPTQSVAQTTSAATSTQAASGSVASLLGKAASITSWKCDVVTTAADNSVTTSTMFVKNKKMRIESNIQGQNTVTLIDIDAKTMYIYTPAQNTAIKMDFNQAPQSAIGSSISQYSPVIIGSETLDGKLCQIVQYTANGVAIKEWIWDAKGLPVRLQTTISNGTSTTDYKNYDFSDISDTMFVLPQGVTITSFNLPTGLPTNLPTNLPSGLPTNLPGGLPSNLPGGLPTNISIPTGIPNQ